MKREEAIIRIKGLYGNGYAEQEQALDMAIEALEMLEEFEKAQIITGGRLNGRTYAYKCGLEDGKRKALEQEPRKITLEDVKGFCKPRCLTIIANEALYELTHPKIKALEQKRWIPASKRLPERRKDVLVTYETEFGKKIAISYFDKYGCVIGDATAWMPLPEPYAESEDEE